MNEEGKPDLDWSSFDRSIRAFREVMAKIHLPTVRRGEDGYWYPVPIDALRSIRRPADDGPITQEEDR